MSTLASIDIKYNSKLDFSSLIDSLIENEWLYNDFGQISYLINGIEESYEWKSCKLGDFNIIKKQLINEFKFNRICGIVLINKTIDSGGQFLFDPSDNSISIIININRITLKNVNLTDYGKYLKELNPIISNYEISSIQSIDVY